MPCTFAASPETQWRALDAIPLIALGWATVERPAPLGASVPCARSGEDTSSAAKLSKLDFMGIPVSAVRYVSWGCSPRMWRGNRKTKGDNGPGDRQAQRATPGNTRYS